MLTAILLALNLAQADDFVSFTVCFLDTRASPWEFRPHPRQPPFRIRPSAVEVIRSVRDLGAGIDCVQIASSGKSIFVVGTVEAVMQKLERK